MASTRTPILPIELLELVFSFCSKSTVFSSCLVSKSWLQPALNVLWKDVPHPEVLFSLLTPWAVERVEVSTFRRTLLLADWKRFDYYASRVRSLRWMEIDESIVGWININFNILTEVARIRPRCVLLPCLRSLFINTEHMEYMSLFLHPALTDLVIGFEPYYTDGSGIEGVCDIFLLLPDMAPGLQSLQINCSYRVSELSPPLGSVLRALSSLRKISLPRYWLSDWVINILGSLPRLEQFDWDYDRGEGALEDLVGFSIPLQDHSFPTLSRIKMELDFPVVQTCLGQFTLLDQLVSIDVTTINRAHSVEIHDFLRLCATRGRSLTELYMDGFPNMPDPSTVDDIINMSILEPVLCRSELTHLVIQYPTQLQLSEDDLRIIGMKLPKLRRLTLAERPFHLAPPLLNISALLVVIEKCPSLESIGLYINGDACKDPIEFVKPLPMLRTLRFGMSPLSKENTREAAFFLSRFLTMSAIPGVPIVNTSDFLFDDSYEDILPREVAGLRRQRTNAWIEVGKMLPNLITARDEERRKIDILEKENVTLMRQGNKSLLYYAYI
ncbi:hypothetical protein M422DRAFT_781500 [Sphaerobolus stellatus SS14]|uniref:F-box domain-containing protein n=1 Tax=Sphaerobolus stellatus (strain SS14) TaxID=990650 RepID=A0A0C9UTR1_SPHS4|nr:hypothetical protein M422DRAFT_781500 [Sphaerobolus stellatus SS14]